MEQTASLGKFISWVLVLCARAQSHHICCVGSGGKWMKVVEFEATKHIK